MDKCIYTIVLLLLVSCYVRGQLRNKYKVCAKFGLYNECQQLDRTNEIECEKNFNSIDCLINVNAGRAFFGSVTPEEALIANRFLNNVVVLAEFRAPEEIFEDSRYQTVVLVSTNFSEGITSLRGARYCHPGFKYDEEVTELLLKEFELELFDRNGLNICSADVETLVEKHVRTLSDFFGPSCRPGPLTENLDLNRRLQESYPSLCELCADGCAPHTNQVFISSLVCLIERRGDIAVTTLNNALKFFNSSDNLSRSQNYRYLCRNGSTNAINSPCVWSKQPWDLIIANREIASSTLHQLRTWLHSYSTQPEITTFTGSETILNPTALESLVSILMPESRRFHKIHFLENPVNLTNYLSGFRNVSSSQNSIQCNTTMRWCTISEREQEKCEWLSQAGANRGIQPIVECFQSTNKVGCIENIRNENADVVNIDTNFGYRARRQDLTALAYAETITRNVSMVLIVIKEANISSLNSIESLRGRSACIPEFAGIEWLAFANTISSSSSSNCDLETLVRDFVGDSCMPGAFIDNSGSFSLDSRLCGLCQAHPINSSTSATCNADASNLFYGRQGALDCLRTAGDFAVVVRNEYNINASSVRVLCANGSLALSTGLDVDENCALTAVINDEVVTKNNIAKNLDLSIALFEFERWFGQDLRKPFEMFNTFNRTPHLLFTDSTPGLDSPSSQNIFIQNYIRQLSQVCVVSLASGLAITPLLFSFVLIVAIFVQ